MNRFSSNEAQVSVCIDVLHHGLERYEDTIGRQPFTAYKGPGKGVVVRREAATSWLLGHAITPMRDTMMQDEYETIGFDKTAQAEGMWIVKKEIRHPDGEWGSQHYPGEPTPVVHKFASYSYDSGWNVMGLKQDAHRDNPEWVDKWEPTGLTAVEHTDIALIVQDTELAYQAANVFGGESHKVWKAMAEAVDSLDDGAERKRAEKLLHPFDGPEGDTFYSHLHTLEYGLERTVGSLGAVIQGRSRQVDSGELLSLNYIAGGSNVLTPDIMDTGGPTLVQPARLHPPFGPL